MHLYINMKQLGKRKNTIDKVAFSYEKAPEDLRELIGEMVKICVADYIDRMDKGEAVLSEEQIEDMSQIGKIAFGIVYGEKKPDVQKAIETAVQGFEDGLFRVFLGDRELENLDEKVEFAEGNEITFIRLTMLAGRMW